MQLYRATAPAQNMSSSPSPPPNSILAWLGAQPGLVAAAACILLRLCSLYLLSGSAFLNFPDGDPRYYLDWALRISHGALTDGQAFFGLPLYPYWLALLFTIFGTSLYVPLVFQCLADTVLAYIVSDISFIILATAISVDRTNEKTIGGAGRVTLAWWTSLGAGLGWVVYQPAQAYAIALMPTTMAVAFFWIIVRWIVRMKSVPSPALAAAEGIGLGIVATLVANLLILVPLIFARFFATGAASRSWSRAAAACVWVLLGIVVGTSPCWIHNYYIAKEPVIFSAHGGINFYLGNQPDASGYPKMPLGMDASQSGLREDSQRLPEEALGRKLTRTEAGQYWSKLAKESIRENPGRWLGLLLRKVRNYWNAFQYDDISIITAMSESGIIAPGPRFGLVAMLGLPGLIAGCFVSRPARWVAAAVVLQMISLLPVFVTERYRLAAVPGLLIGASVGIYWAWRWISNAEWIPLLRAYLVPLALSIWLVNLPTRDSSLWALDLYNSSRVLLANGDVEIAGEKARRALAFSPDNPEIQFLLGNYWLKKGDRENARKLYWGTLMAIPEHGRAWNNLGVVELADGHWAEARRSLMNASRLTPSDAKIHYLLARAAQGQGDWPGALEEIRLALSMEPDRIEFQTLEKAIQSREPVRPFNLETND